MARPKQAEHRRRKRQAEEAQARAQSSWAAANPSTGLFAEPSPAPARAALPPLRPAETVEMAAMPKIGEVVFAAGAFAGAYAEDDEESDDEEAVVDGIDAELGDEDDYEEDEEVEAEEVDDEHGRGGPPRKKAKKNKGGGAQVLPVADLPDDWEGDVEDGATYLALAMRADKALPTYTRAANPWSSAAGVKATDDTTTAEVDLPNVGDVQPEAGPSRHPALPKESWQAVFPLHFVAYKKHIAESWPPSPPLPYPSTWPRMPPTYQRGEWGWYINGYPRKKIPPPVRSSSMPAGKGKGKAVAVEMDEEEAANAANGDGEADMDVEDEDEEEAAMNLAREVMEDVMEPLAEKHKARDPHACILQKLDTPQIITVLSTLTTHIQNTLTPLETNLIPESYDPLTSSSTRRPHTRKNPYSEHYSRWIFALLLVLDPFLSAEQVSVLRELARVIIRVGGWRWVEAVMGGEVGLPATGPAGDEREGTEGTERVHWMLGARWKYARDTREANGAREAEMARPAKEQITPSKREEYDETGVDETLARCWLVVHAIAAGWGQKDLVMDLEEMFS